MPWIVRRIIVSFPSANGRRSHPDPGTAPDRRGGAQALDFDVGKGLTVGGMRC